MTTDFSMTEKYHPAPEIRANDIKEASNPVVRALGQSDDITS